MSRWEYLILCVTATDLEKLERRMNNLGLEGWEVVSVLPSSSTHTIYLKRQKK